MDDAPIPASYEEAGERLERSASAVRDWVTRYHLRRVGKVGRRVYVDYRDAATIDACMHRGDPIPATPTLRDELRASRAA